MSALILPLKHVDPRVIQTKQKWPLTETLLTPRTARLRIFLLAEDQLRQLDVVYVSHRPTKTRRDETPGDVAPDLIARYRLALCFVAALGVAAAAGLGAMLKSSSAPSVRHPAGARAALDASRFVLNALLVPALDDDALPLRWVDPRPALQCAPGSDV